ncbi:hypothetical protein IF690_04925 [Pseudomonas sp. SK3(2021)]|uniref:hypothetical protein n=1 Tax=Pseudomonas sp. SK3(2021) TaxID=2841064 RepID=UPI00192AB9AC|nr:hypothetical protein [Pseudomonas sp. SK3(2021)]QQZ42890.1 hypothetical protein IF690_04925 [Pseudomonas sp. SK3(2021)]
MTSKGKKLSNPFSTGGGGGHFESHVQASFVALMLTGGYAPCLPCRPISKIKLQGKFSGYSTDDLIIFTQGVDGTDGHKLLGQVKHSITITDGDAVFGEVIQSAWTDFNNEDLFNKRSDVIALITGPLSATDTGDVRTILDWARHAENPKEFFEKVELAHFSSATKRAKLQAFKLHLKAANNDVDLTPEETFEFLRCFYLLGYDLDIKAGVTLALLHSLIGLYSTDNVESTWARLVGEVQSANQNAGTIFADNLPEDLLLIFRQRKIEEIPPSLAVPRSPKPVALVQDHEQLVSLTVAALLGGWNESNECDIEVVRGLVDGF